MFPIKLWIYNSNIRFSILGTKPSFISFCYNPLCFRSLWRIMWWFWWNRSGWGKIINNTSPVNSPIHPAIMDAWNSTCWNDSSKERMESHFFLPAHTISFQLRVIYFWLDYFWHYLKFNLNWNLASNGGGWEFYFFYQYEVRNTNFLRFAFFLNLLLIYTQN